MASPTEHPDYNAQAIEIVLGTGDDDAPVAVNSELASVMALRAQNYQNQSRHSGSTSSESEAEAPAFSLSAVAAEPQTGDTGVVDQCYPMRVSQTALAQEPIPVPATVAPPPQPVVAQNPGPAESQQRRQYPEWELGRALWSRIPYDVRFRLMNMPSATPEQREARAVICREVRAANQYRGPVLQAHLHPQFNAHGTFDQYCAAQRRAVNHDRVADQRQPVPPPLAMPHAEGVLAFQLLNGVRNEPIGQVGPPAPYANPDEAVDRPQPAAIPAAGAVEQGAAPAPGAAPVQNAAAGVGVGQAIVGGLAARDGVGAQALVGNRIALGGQPDPTYDPPGSGSVGYHFGPSARRYYVRSTQMTYERMPFILLTLAFVAFSAACAVFERIEVLFSLTYGMFSLVPCALLAVLGSVDDERNNDNPILWTSIGRCRPLNQKRAFLWLCCLIGMVTSVVLFAILVWFTTLEVVLSQGIYAAVPAVSLLMLFFVQFLVLRRDVGLTVKTQLTLQPPVHQVSTRVTTIRVGQNGDVQERTNTLDDRQAADQFSTLSDDNNHIAYGEVRLAAPQLGEGALIDAAWVVVWLFCGSQRGRVVYSAELVSQFNTAAASSWMNTVDSMTAKIWRTMELYSKSPVSRWHTFLNDNYRNGSAWVAVFIARSQAEIAASELPKNILPQITAFST